MRRRPPSSVRRAFSPEEEGVSYLKTFKDIKAEMSVGKLVGVLIFVVIAMALLPTIISATNAGVNSSDDYGSAQTLLSLVPLFYVIAILVAVIMWVVHETGGTGAT
jgi:hypothetical protein